MRKLVRYSHRALWASANRFGFLGAPHVGTSPSLDENALDRWRHAVFQGGVYLEYGSGGSTIEALQHADAVVTVETDKRFLRAVEKKVSKLPIETAQFYPIYVDIGWTEKWGRPLIKRPSESRVARWRRYTSAPWEELAKSGLVPNFIFVDGRFRAASVLESLIRLPDDEDCLIMLDDFAARESTYGPIMPFIADVEKAGRALLFRRAFGFSRKDCGRLLLQLQADPE